MPDTLAPVDPRQAWLQNLHRIGGDHGFFNRLSARHLALFVDEGDTLVLSFDRADRIWGDGNAGLPLGFDCVRALEYSLLSILSMGRTWFHDTGVEDLFQGLARDGFFASYARVVILAVGPDCGHAAARAARHVPGARVLLVRPAAAIGAIHAPFETRFTSDRHGDPDVAPLGPEALLAARATTILFDPKIAPDAAQAALFRAPGTQRIALPHASTALDRAVTRGGALVPLTGHLAAGTLTPRTARDSLKQVLRRDPVYLTRLVRAADAKGHPGRAAKVLRT
ncbi:hypothetical protein [Jannaschia sp. CCS1]|uniref:hypothetical protein n=1 Tax=Jannaschia sp. (strain CCS1) TaxID=290400 RepID=UPI0002FD97C7|nr:hypothetical protein [Jannaschia sp. CCS1]